MCWPVLSRFKLIFRALHEFLTGSLGAQLGRLEAEVVLEMCLSRFPTLRLVDASLQWRTIPIVRTPDTLPVTW